MPPDASHPTTVDGFICALNEDLNELVAQTYTLAFHCRTTKACDATSLLSVRLALDKFHQHTDSLVALPGLATQTVKLLLESGESVSPDVLNKLLHLHCHHLSQALRDVDDLVKQLIIPHLSVLTTIPAILQPFLEHLEAQYDSLNAGHIPTIETAEQRQISDNIQQLSELIASCSQIISMGSIGLSKKNLPFFDLPTRSAHLQPCQPELFVVQQKFSGNGRDTDTACLLWPSSYVLSSLLSIYTQLSQCRPSTTPHLHHFSIPTTPSQLAHMKSTLLILPSQLLAYSPPTAPISLQPTHFREDQTTLNILEVGCGTAALPTILTAKLLLRYHQSRDSDQFKHIDIDYSDMNNTILAYSHQHILHALSNIPLCDPPTLRLTVDTTTHHPPRLLYQSDTSSISLNPTPFNWLDCVDPNTLSRISPLLSTQNEFTSCFEAVLSTLSSLQGQPHLLSQIQQYQRNHPSHKYRNFTWSIQQLFENAQAALLQKLSEQSCGMKLSPKIYDLVLCSDCVYDGFHAIAVPFVFHRHTTRGSIIWCSIGDLIRLEGGYQLIQLFLAMMAIFQFRCVNVQLPIFEKGASAPACDHPTRFDELLSSKSSPTFAPDFTFVFIRE